MGLGISIKVIMNFNNLIAIEDEWNYKLNKSMENPFLFSRLLSLIMHSWEEWGWTPLAVIFLHDNKIVGMMPLKIRKRLQLINCSTLHPYLYSVFYLPDEYRKICMTQLIDFLFKHLKCHVVALTIQDSSPNLKVLTKICQKKGFHLRKTHFNGRAILPIEHDWDVYYGTLKVKVRKEFRRIRRKLDDLGSWRISCYGIDSESIEKIIAVEQMSWKTTWRAQKKIQKDWLLHIILRASQKQGEIVPSYEIKVWFLEVKGQTIAYLLMMLYKGTAFFVKTSYDAQFKEISPGKFLMNETIRKMHINGNVKKIDFITNLPIVQIWKPMCENRTKLIIKKNMRFSIILRFAEENLITRKFVKLAKGI